MIDTVATWLSINETGRAFDLDLVARGLTNVKRVESSEGQYITGNLSNLRVNVSPLVLRTDGSLPVYMFGDSFHTLTRAGIEEAISSISDHLHIDMLPAKVRRVDIAHNLIVKHTPCSYFPFLQGYKNHYRHTSKSSLYFQSNPATLCFYDKIKEGIKKGWTVPEVYQNREVLRYEHGIKKGAAKQLKEPSLTFGSLTDETVYIKLIDHWANAYHTIKKTGSKINIEKMKIETPKDLEKCLAALQAQSIGYENLMSIVQRITPTHNNSIKRHREKVLELLSLPGQDETFEMTEELSKQVEQVRMHYR